MEEREIDEEAELLREVTGNVAVVEVDSGDGADFRVVWSGSTVNTCVVAHSGSYPIEG